MTAGTFQGRPPGVMLVAEGSPRAWHDREAEGKVGQKARWDRRQGGTDGKVGQRAKLMDVNVEMKVWSREHG
eukprot:366170-Chlamydomonas_euryale.AAC.3